MICKFCGENKRLIKAHIIPEAFFRRLRTGQIPLLMTTNSPGKHPKRLPVGVYDGTIVCADCEKIWGQWDSYGQSFLGDIPLGGKPLSVQGRTVAYMVEQYDYVKLKLFFISLLWRASASSQPYYARISLGSVESKAKELILNRNPGTREQFSVTLAKFDHPLGTGMLDPHKERPEGINYCRFYLGGYVAYIKTDSRPGVAHLRDFALSPSGPLYVIARDLERSKELPLIKKMLKNPLVGQAASRLLARRK